MNILFNTKLRRKLLAYSFTHTDEDFYVREIAAFINEDPGNLSRELRRMEEEGLFTSRIKGRAKYYSLNRGYPLFKELKEIVFKTEGVEGSLRRIVNGYKGISTAFIYGSYAKGSEKRGSDIDLILVGKYSQTRFTRDIRILESKLNREINFTSYTSIEYEKEKNNIGGFLNGILKGKIICLKGEPNAGGHHI